MQFSTARLLKISTSPIFSQGAWEDRLKSPIFSRLEMSKYFFEIERKFQQEGRGSAVDVEIFSNAALLPPPSMPLSSDLCLERLEQLKELLRRFRLTEQTCLMMPSTHHAVVRAFVDGGNTDTLMSILNQRLEYGVFPDEYTSTFLLNHFTGAENLRDASKVAIVMMLQEEYNIPIASQLALYSTYLYVKQMKDAVEPWDPQPIPLPEEPEDEVKVRVQFLESPYKDDHFDLTQRDHLLGKTLAKFGLHGLMSESVEAAKVKKSLQLLGWTSFEKWDKVLELCNGHTNGTLVQDCVLQAQAIIAESSAGDEATRTQAAEALAQLKVTEFDIEAFLDSEVVKAVQESEAKLIQV